MFPPSGASRWLVCPLSVKLAPLFPQKDSAASIEGTKKHAEAAMHLNNDTYSKNSKLQQYINLVRCREGQRLVEYEVTIVPDLCWGTLDAAVLGTWEMSLFDLKWGKDPVQAVGNPQLLCYGVGLLREYPRPRKASVNLSIVQPNTTSGWPTKRWDTDVQTILDFRPKVMAAIDAAMKDNPKGVPGKHCFWCPAKLHCEAYLHSIGRKKSLL